MRGHAAHMWMCGAMVVGALAIVLFTGNPSALLPVVGCVLMMGGTGGHDDHRGGDRRK